RSADSLVRESRPAREQPADKAVRAPRKSSQHATKLGDSTAENAELRREKMISLRPSAPSAPLRLSGRPILAFHPSRIAPANSTGAAPPPSPPSPRRAAFFWAGERHETSLRLSKQTCGQ